ncbi:SpoVA/SpoVAEb family sporulation membrane protein [Flavonifractor plautii]|nr:SpoVA/SpoVAEb family sporulation membrane protein [Flavonifractor plautii]
MTGGLICTGGQALLNLFRGCGLNENAAGTAVSVTIIFLAALFTGLGLFDKLAKHAGAGTLVPITGFANAVVSPGAGIQVRGAGHGRGRQDVCDRRAGAGLRHQRLRALRRDSPALFPGIKSGKRAAQAAPLFPSGLQKN